ncbi:MAG: tripartite tricarboxylate transporter substrate binding protein [Desulfovibrio sp.]|nr:tripartite tricarboxylate transporter substrate binding protein [Desulfovibrio sp.]
MLKHLCVMFACCAMLILGTTAKADQPFPKAEPINYLIPFSAGGESDLFARAQMPYLEKELGQKIVISYKIGAGGAVAWSELARSKPTGYYTVGFNIPHIILQPLERKDAGYQTNGLKPVMTFHVTPCVLAVSADSPYKALEELLKAAKEKPGSVIIGGVGNSTAGHIACVMLNKFSGIQIPYIPFPGTADLPIALLGKHVTAIMAFTSGATQYVKEMRPLAVASETRAPGFENVPTFKELGFNIVEGSFRGLAVPKGTPDDIVEVLYKACAKINKIPEFAKKMTSMGMKLIDMDPKESQKFFDRKVEEYKTILANLKKK